MPEFLDRAVDDEYALLEEELESLLQESDEIKSKMKAILENNELA